MYKFFVRPLLFLAGPETIHHFTFSLLKWVCKIPGVRHIIKARYGIHPALEKKIWGLTFKSPVGLAAGFDKDAKLIDELDCFGFGFIEIGTLTPQGQSGNKKPRLFRLPLDNALINRMGFNNEGVLKAVTRLKKRKARLIIGGNIGKNKSTPNEQAFEDYNYCFETLFPFVDYFVVNVSSPNTPGLRQLQEKDPLKNLLLHIRSLSQSKDYPKPILLKVSPDLTVGELDDVIEVLQEVKIDGIIASNTTISREGLLTRPERIKEIGNGGLSGKPLGEKSTAMIAYLRTHFGPDFPIIGVGGIMSPADALEKIKAGADLIQIYTGFIYEGPRFVRQINAALLDHHVKRLKS